ncbi:PREDICTED: protein phosphatase 1 regulatory subunit 1C isoform X1 [Cercocebus atys]|uniref:protein phosphatase 1 regulatory subunit 1C isoform X1 n=1 Tax=Cercocebus atys TaxID=9531 RepID=UPI0005F3791A|nr:PREDICTED: protein phosphatase 1 regulatory subunit 1C isoform X1 [Cercocebus atys]
MYRDLREPRNKKLQKPLISDQELRDVRIITTDKRKRRPTPASLVILNEHNPPEIDDKRVPNTQGESQNASPKQRKQSVYTPPIIKGVKHLKGQNESAFPEEEEGTSEREEQQDH